MKTLEQLAREAGGFVGPNAEGLWMFEPDDLARFRAACRAEALEEAAQVAESVVALYVEQGGDESGAGKPSRAIKHCAAAIREMK